MSRTLLQCYEAVIDDTEKFLRKLSTQLRKSSITVAFSDSTKHQIITFFARLQLIKEIDPSVARHYQKRRIPNYTICLAMGDAEGAIHAFRERYEKCKAKYAHEGEHDGNSNARRAETKELTIFYAEALLTGNFDLIKRIHLEIYERLIEEKHQTAMSPLHGPYRYALVRFAAASGSEKVAKYFSKKLQQMEKEAVFEYFSKKLKEDVKEWPKVFSAPTQSNVSILHYLAISGNVALTQKFINSVTVAGSSPSGKFSYTSELCSDLEARCIAKTFTTTPEFTYTPEKGLEVIRGGCVPLLYVLALMGFEKLGDLFSKRENRFKFGLKLYYGVSKPLLDLITGYRFEEKKHDQDTAKFILKLINNCLDVKPFEEWVGELSQDELGNFGIALNESITLQQLILSKVFTERFTRLSLGSFDERSSACFVKLAEVILDQLQDKKSSSYLTLRDQYLEISVRRLISFATTEVNEIRGAQLQLSIGEKAKQVATKFKVLLDAVRDALDVLRVNPAQPERRFNLFKRGAEDASVDDGKSIFLMKMIQIHNERHVAEADELKGLAEAAKAYLEEGTTSETTMQKIEHMLAKFIDDAKLADVAADALKDCASPPDGDDFAGGASADADDKDLTAGVFPL